MLANPLEIIADRPPISPHVGAHLQILVDREMRKHPAALRAVRDTELEDLGGLMSVNVASREDDTALGGAQEPGNRPQRRCLAGPVGAQQADELAFLNLEIQAPQGRDRPVRRVDALKPEQRRIPGTRG
jgi:hypothetical protein